MQLSYTSLMRTEMFVNELSEFFDFKDFLKALVLNKKFRLIFFKHAMKWARH